MTPNLVLNVIKKEKTGEKKEAPEGAIPGVLYGRGIENLMFWVNGKEFDCVHKDAGESTIFKAKFENGEERNVLIKEVQRDILNGKPIHIDFYQVRMDEEIEATVELEFIGESPIMKEQGGVLVKNIDEIQVRCLPGDLPSKIQVDISKIKSFDDYIYIKDLPVSDKIEISADPKTVVAMVSKPRSEEELAELDTEVKEDVTKVEGVAREEKPASDESLADKSTGKPEGEENKTEEAGEADKKKAKKKE